MVLRALAIIGTGLVASTAAQAAPASLREEDLKAAIAGKTVKIDTPLGLPLTVNYGANGVMTGTVGTALAAYLGSARDRGRWKVRKGMLCQKWFKWLASDETCMSIRQDGLKIYWHTDTGKTGTASIEPGPPILAGASASGLGAPPPPEPPPPAAREPNPDVAADVPANVATDATNDAPQGPTAAEDNRIRPEAPAVAEADRGEPAPAPRTSAAETAPAPQRSREPRAVAQARVDAPWMTRSAPSVTLASLTPVTPPARKHRPDLFLRPPAGGPPDDAFALPVDLQAMRSAVDLAATGALEHRWCLDNALGTAPVAKPTADATRFARPSLMTIAEEQTSPEELALYEPSCLTSEPVLYQVARQALTGN